MTSFLSSDLYKVFLGEYNESINESLKFEREANLDDQTELAKFKNLRATRQEQERTINYFTSLNEDITNEIKYRKEDNELKRIQQERTQGTV